MPTPLTPDEEFDALFRRGLEHHPEQPETPAAWHRMDLLLDAGLRQRALRRQVLRLLGAESVLLVLLLWLCWVVVPGRLPQATKYEQLAARQGQAAGTSPGRTADGPGRLAETSIASAAAASRSTLPPESALVARSAPAAASATQPFLNEGKRIAQPATTPSIRLATPAGRKASVSRRPESAGRQLTAGMNRPKNTGRFRAQKDALLALGNSATLAKNQPKTSAVAVAAATPAAQRRGRLLPLAAGRQPAESLARWPQRGQKNPAAAVAAYATARAATNGSRSRVLATGRRAHQGPATAPAGSLAAAARTKQITDAPDYGTVIAPLALRWPATYAALDLPDSLRPVAPAARPAPADSLPARPQLQPYRLQLGLVAAPERSAVRPSRLSPPGPSVGGQLDYQLARRWHLGTAFLYSVKRYGAAGTDYTVPHPLPHGWVIRDVDAVCRIIDIPLNVRYDVWQQPRYQAFISAGLSSLFMKREQYTYNYDPVYGQPIPSYAIEVDNGSRHLLKVLNLSAGYERRLGARWSAQAEAFAKLPLAGVGYGAVRLRSAGVFFSLRYGLLPGRAATGQR